VTASRVDTTRLSSLEIDKTVRAAVGDGCPLYAIDRELLEALQPDLILTQNLCAVCAVPADNVSELRATDAEVVASTRTRSPRSKNASARSPTCSAGTRPHRRRRDGEEDRSCPSSRGRLIAAAPARRGQRPTAEAPPEDWVVQES